MKWYRLLPAHISDKTLVEIADDGEYVYLRFPGFDEYVFCVPFEKWVGDLAAPGVGRRSEGRSGQLSPGGSGQLGRYLQPAGTWVSNEHWAQMTAQHSPDASYRSPSEGWVLVVDGGDCTLYCFKQKTSGERGETE